MAAASVVPLRVKTSLDSVKKWHAAESASAQIIPFPRRQTAEEVVREWVILSAQYMPHIYPGGLPRNLEKKVAKWLQLVNFRDDVGACFIDRCRAEIAQYKASLAKGWTSSGRIGDPKAEAYWHECCVRSYGEPEEGHEA